MWEKATNYQKLSGGPVGSALPFGDQGMLAAKVAALHATDSVHFPTEHCSREKARKRAGHAAKSRPQIVEGHRGDCGDESSPLGEDDVAISYYKDSELDYLQVDYAAVQYDGTVFYEDNFARWIGVWE